MLQFVLRRKADSYEKVRETCLNYAENQKSFILLVEEKVIDLADSVQKKDEK